MFKTRKVTSAKTALPNRIRHARRFAQLSQARLAKALGVGPSAVAQWESPRGTFPTVENLLKIAAVCDVAFEWLATGRGTAHLDPRLTPAIDTTSLAGDHLEERLLIAFRRVVSRKRELFVRWLEEMF